MIRRANYSLLAVSVILLCTAAPALAQRAVFQLDPAASKVEFTLGAVLHTVHGSFQLKSGMIQFDPSTGSAAGQLVVDATSGNTGSKDRDRKMHREILESQKYPEIAFFPEHITGTLTPDATSQMEMQGRMMLHGQSHPMTITMPVQLKGDTAYADAKFTIPYVRWGLKNPSTLLLRVSDKVDISVHVVGRLAKQSAALTSLPASSIKP